MPPRGGGGGLPREVVEEGVLLGALRHARIVRVIAACAEPPCLVYELCRGGSLASRLAPGAERGLAWEARVRVAWELAETLCFMHTCKGEVAGKRHEGVYHRDVKPENVLLADEDVAFDAARDVIRLADFGTARAALGAKTLEELVTQTMTKIVGTPPYMCPRYLNSGRFGGHSE